MNFADLKGKTLISVNRGRTGASYRASDTLEFVTDDGWRVTCQHHQDCCESVRIEDIVGNLQDLVGSPIVLADEASEPKQALTAAEKRSQAVDIDDNSMWTFYRLATVKGYVTVRWYGTSNGFYSMRVSTDWERTSNE